MNLKTPALLALCLSLLALSACSQKTNPAPVVWKLTSPEITSNTKIAIIGTEPSVNDNALRFDGKTQGLLMPTFPIAGCAAYTVEMDIFPEAGGEFEQRFFHGGTSEGPRMMIELRSNPDGSWYLDTHIRDTADHRLTLIDPAKPHPSGQWYTVKMVYDGKTLTHYVDGVLEGETTGAIVAPMPESPVSLGVRQNKVCWFKGMIREVRFYPEAKK